MNKKQFLETLYASLNPLSSDERADILSDFEEHFNVGFDEGKTESEIAEGLGSPYKIATELLATYHIEKEAYRPPAADATFRSILIAIGMGFFNLIIVLGPFMALVGIMFAGWVVGITFIMSPLLVSIGSLIYLSSFESFDLFISLMLAGLGLFIIIGMTYLTRLAASLLNKYIRFNIDFIKGGGRRE